ncbi:hypothetical protein HC891_19430, partial [Candidatus Gracilibacteria bacterium]|nr:hypothetical protein [Candidatus Gracilibacteria bacterium]
SHRTWHRRCRWRLRNSHGHTGTARAIIHQRSCSRHGQAETPDGAYILDGRVWGCYVHGLFASATFRYAWLASLGWAGNNSTSSPSDPYDRLADVVEAAIASERLGPLLRGDPPQSPGHLADYSALRQSFKKPLVLVSSGGCTAPLTSTNPFLNLACASTVTYWRTMSKWKRPSGASV